MRGGCGDATFPGDAQHANEALIGVNTARRPSEKKFRYGDLCDASPQ